MLSLVSAGGRGQAQTPSLEQRLGSPDSAVAGAATAELLRAADRAEPLMLMLAATHLARAGKMDDAVFWFYAGQLRARYSLKLKGENSQLVQIFTMVGTPINMHAQRDIVGMGRTIDRVLAWDAQTVAAWAGAHGHDPADPTLAADRLRARQGLQGLMAELNGKRAHYEQLARDWKSPEQEQREYAERIQRRFSTQPLERVVAGKTFRVPANHVTRVGLDAAPREAVSSLALMFFLPDLAGYRKDDPLELSGNTGVMWVRLNDTSEPRRAVEMFEAFIAARPPTVRVFGADAHLFDGENNPGRLSLPLHGYRNEYVFHRDRPGGERVYMSCRAPVPHRHSPNPQCRLFMRHAASGLRFNAQFSQAHGDRWVTIVETLHARLDAWYVRD